MGRKHGKEEDNFTSVLLSCLRVCAFATSARLVCFAMLSGSFRLISFVLLHS